MTVQPAPAVPSTVKMAALLLLAYGAIVFINATWSQIDTEWVHASYYPRALP